MHYRVAVGSGIPISDSHTPGVLFNVTSVFSGAKQRPDPEECDKDEQHASVVQINAYLATPYIVKQTLSTAHLSSNREVIGTPTGPKPVIAVSFYGARSRCAAAASAGVGGLRRAASARGCRAHATVPTVVRRMPALHMGPASPGPPPLAHPQVGAVPLHADVHARRCGRAREDVRPLCGR